MTNSYRDPRWQKLRLEVMQRDGFACQACGSVDKTLNVHHLVYCKGKPVWEHPEIYLVTLCEDCHEGTELAVRAVRSNAPCHWLWRTVLMIVQSDYRFREAHSPGRESYEWAALAVIEAIRKQMNPKPEPEVPAENQPF